MQHSGGVGSSAAVRFSSAPGQMSEGSNGGLGLMDKEGTQKGTGELADRNPQPDSSVAAEYSKLGLDKAWKVRK